MSYTKLSSDIVYSTIWSEDAETCKVWITLLAIKDKDGIVTANPVGIARIASLPIESVDRALEKFQQPDPRSNTDEHGGRRIGKVERGFLVLNHEKYRESGWSDEKKEKERQRKADYRARIGSKTSTPKPPAAANPEATTVLNTLNLMAGKKFRPVPANLEPISARLKEPGVTLEGVEQMIDRQCRRWNGSKMEEYLRPETLFGKQKFDSYYAAREMPIENGEANMSVQELRTVIAAKESIRSGLLRHRSEVAGGHSWTDMEAKKRYQQLGAEIKALTQEMADMA